MFLDSCLRCCLCFCLGCAPAAGIGSTVSDPSSNRTNCSIRGGCLDVGIGALDSRILAGSSTLVCQICITEGPGRLRTSLLVVIPFFLHFRCLRGICLLAGHFDMGGEKEECVSNYVNAKHLQSIMQHSRLKQGGVLRVGGYW